jgi:2,3-diketo-5-methylthio-1-phosphopentane phosphatase
MKVVLCDIEGTTTDISFVKDVLFPYARDQCKDFLNQHFEDPEVKQMITDLCTLSVENGTPIAESEDRETLVNSVVEFVHLLIREDRKVKELKNLQGKIWKVGFENGTLKGKIC